VNIDGKRGVKLDNKKQAINFCVIRNRTWASWLRYSEDTFAQVCEETPWPESASEL
jgi:hypothetical protein